MNSASKTFRIVFLTRIPSKYHKNSIRIPVLFAKKWVVFHWNNSEKHVVNLDKIGGSTNGIPSKFRCDSRFLPLEYCFKISAFFLEGEHMLISKLKVTNSLERCLFFSVLENPFYLIFSLRFVIRISFKFRGIGIDSKAFEIFWWNRIIFLDYH